MKTKTAMNRIPTEFIFRTGYCDLQYIFHGVEPQFYNSGVYGWNCDIYTDCAEAPNGRLYSLAITTGYRNLRGARIPDSLIDEYTNRAKQIIENRYWSTDIREPLARNRDEFLMRVLASSAVFA